jgi:thymidine kinase
MKPGSLTVYCGPMFSGKTTALLSHLRRWELAHRKVCVYKPRIDDRYDPEFIVTHGKDRTPAQVAATSAEVLRHALSTRPELVGIDEGQFFDDGLVFDVEHLRAEGISVVVAALDRTATGEPFGCVPQLLALADAVHKLAAVCVRCGADATRSYRTASTDDTVMIGGADKYEARCAACWTLGGAA